MLELIGWIGFLFLLIGYYLNANQNILCFYIWGIGNIILTYYAIMINAMPQVAVGVVVFGMNIYGYRQWKK